MDDVTVTESLTPDNILLNNDHSIRRRRTRSVLKKSGLTVEPPRDQDVFYVSDDEYGFLTEGRDYEPINVTHRYTEKEIETLGAHESEDYLPSHSEIYRKWIGKQKVSGFDWDRWVMMGVIGFVVGVTGFLLHQGIEGIAHVKWKKAQEFIQDGNYAVAWIFSVAYSMIFIFFSAAVVIFLRPSAGGSGIPEIAGFLNGTHLRHIFNIRTYAVKFLSCVAAVGGGMPIGPEGPMIHMGAAIGAGLSQVKSETLRIKFKIFERLKTTSERRNFISAGAAAGVASAFGSPVGGLLFSMEEVSSFWTVTLSWQIFFCCMVCTVTTDLLNSAFSSFHYSGNFGQFKNERYILFQVDKGIDVNILMFIPTVLIGVLGGVLGAMFTILNLKITRTRKRILSSIKNSWVQRIFRLLEPLIVILLMTTVSIVLPAAFKCTSFTCVLGDTGVSVKNCLNDTRHPLHVEYNLTRYSCPQGTVWKKIGKNYTTYYTNGTYNEVASLLFGTVETAVKHLFSRDTHLEFNFPSLFTVLPFYFFMVVWASGTSIACGILVPMLMIGGLYGRIIGRMLVTLFGMHTSANSYWVWMDPGAFALIGAASFFGGVTRLTLATTVIMMEMTNDVQVLLPVMVGVMVAKWVGDFFTHPVYHALLELKCIPFLDPEPRVTINKKLVNLELYCVKDIMSSPVITVKTRELIQVLADLLLHTTHGGFPVVKESANGEIVFYGIITRMELTVLLMNDALFEKDSDEIDDKPPSGVTWIEYQQININKLNNPGEVSDLLHKFVESNNYRDIYINLLPYVNESAMTVQEKFSLYRTYVVFRTLGLRHLTVVNNMNQVSGIITRKDLMGFNMQQKLIIVTEQRCEGTRMESRVSVI